MNCQPLPERDKPGRGDSDGHTTRHDRRTTILRAGIEELAGAKILGVRAGTEHRYTGVWVVVVEGRVFVRSWNDKPTGWYRAFQAQPLGSIQLAGREIAIRQATAGRSTAGRGHPGLRGEVRHEGVGEVGARLFAEPHRSATTLELLPVNASSGVPG